jgi:hypothetical protein
MKEEGLLNDTYFSDNIKPLDSWRKNWLEYLKKVYIQCFFNQRENDYLKDPMNCANSDRSIYSVITVNQASQQCMRYLAQSITFMLFHGFTAIKMKDSNEESGYVLPNSIGKILKYYLYIKL